MIEDASNDTFCLCVQAQSCALLSQIYIDLSDGTDLPHDLVDLDVLIDS